MQLQVIHDSRYEYDREVGFSAHALYLRPRETAQLRLKRYKCEIEPSARLVQTLDSHDNPLIWAWIEGRSRRLRIRSEFEIETLATNPFDFILRPGASVLPVAYDAVDRFALASYLAPPFDETQALLRQWVRGKLPGLAGDTVGFLDAVNRLVCSAIRYQHREEGFSQPSILTIERGSGSCRDLAVLLLEICRTFGFGARFVSGYMYDPPEPGTTPLPAAMHAWAEVFLPGAGWLGLDPTRGIFCNEAFVPVAHAAQADQVTPIQGNYVSKESVNSKLTVFVEVNRQDKPA
jgi:transglutaminase-like putative cysteine protease